MLSPMSSPTNLSAPERALAAIIGVGFSVAAYFALAQPPKVLHASPNTGCKATECTVSVATDTQTLVVALAALAGAALLIALLGVRFTKVTAGSVTLDQGTVGEVSKDDAKTKQLKTDAQAPAATGEAIAAASERPWDLLPEWAQNSLLIWATSGTTVTRPLTAAVVSAVKGSGKGNRPWYVTVELDNKETRVLRVATGKGSQTVRHEEDD
jgi:hypothetical protein